MKKMTISAILFILGSVAFASAQQRATFTGTAVIYGSGFNTRTVTRSFTLRINGRTPGSDVARYLSTLQENGQEGLLRAVHNNDLGTFSLGGQPSLRLNAVTVDEMGNGRQRIRAVMERWIGFGELRGGYRSVDYPFSYIEINLDPNGSGEGTFIPAAQIRFRNKNGQQQVEIEDFGTFPGRLMGVKMRGRLA
jgi:hypothetical protein